MDIKLSIIIPVYNVAPYLRECLDSVLRASCLVPRGAVEVICVDDGSTDGSSEILDSYLQLQFPTTNIKVIHQANQGVSAARNRGLEEARGEWIGFVDADDTIGARWFEKALTIIEAHPNADIVRVEPLTSIWKDDDLAAAQAKAERSRVEKIRVYEGEAAKRAALSIYSRWGWPMMNFVRKAALGELRFPVGVRLKEDVRFFMELGLRAKTLVTASYPGYFYRRREGSAVMRARQDADSLVFARELLALGRKYRDAELWREITVSLGYDFVQWADERDRTVPYDAERCEIRRIWRDLMTEGGDHLDEMYWWWRLAIRRWIKTGNLKTAHRIRRIREWIGKFI